MKYKKIKYDGYVYYVMPNVLSVKFDEKEFVKLEHYQRCLVADIVLGEFNVIEKINVSLEIVLDDYYKN